MTIDPATVDLMIIAAIWLWCGLWAIRLASRRSYRKYGRDIYFTDSWRAGAILALLLILGPIGLLVTWSTT